MTSATGGDLLDLTASDLRERGEELLRELAGPEARLREDQWVAIEALVVTPVKLLDAVWTTLASGGVLVYATCSILQRENAGQIAAFLARTPDASAEPLTETYGHEAGAGRQRLPGEDGMDGFFYARLRKL